MRLAFVVQRYGLDVSGGAEYHCRLVAERLARRAQVEVLTTCATDYVTWANAYPPGTEVMNGVLVRRFPVERPRDPYRFRDWSRQVARPGHDEADELRWLEEEGPLSTALVRHVAARQADHDVFVFFSYRYYTTYHGLRALGRRALLVPTAEDDGTHRLAIFAPFFRLPGAIAYNSPEEREMIQAVSGNEDVPAEVVGIGSALPEAVDADRFRRRHGVDGRFVLYVGRIDRNKGCDQLFEFFLRYRRETGSPLRLVLAGQPVLPVPDDPAIVPLGFVPDADKWDALAAADLLVMPSFFESLSMVTLEAWWAGRPVLANAKCDVLRGQCRRANAGLYYATYDEFREALGLLEADQGLRRALGESGRRYFEAHYAWDVIERKYDALIAAVHSANEKAGAGEPVPGTRERRGARGA